MVFSIAVNKCLLSRNLSIKDIIGMSITQYWILVCWDHIIEEQRYRIFYFKRVKVINRISAMALNNLFIFTFLFSRLWGWPWRWMVCLFRNQFLIVLSTNWHDDRASELGINQFMVMNLKMWKSRYPFQYHIFYQNIINYPDHKQNRSKVQRVMNR